MKTNYRYFISGKAYFDSTLGNSINGFGDVEIKPIVLNSGTELPVSLHTSLVSGDVLPLTSSQ